MNETNKPMVQTKEEHMELYNLAIEYSKHPEDYSTAEISEIIEAQLIKAWNKGYQERCFPTYDK